LKILSRRPDSNPQPIQQNNEAFHQSNQKHNKKLMKTLTTLLNLVFICQNNLIKNSSIELEISNYINYLAH